jgi:hypothetical protein
MKAMNVRIEAIMKADPSIRSAGSAMLKLAESRDPADQELWREFKNGTALEGAVAKDFDVAKALKRMSKRCDELQATDPTLSRNSAIAKVAASPDPADRQLWERYKAANAPAGSGEHLVRPDYRTPSERALNELIRGLKAMHPDRRMSDSDWRREARRVQAHASPSVQALVRYRA